MVTISKVLDSLENFLQDFGAMDFESMDLGEDAFFEEEIDWDDLSTILAVPPSRGEEHLQRIKGETQGLAETNATNSKTRNIPTTNHQTQKVTVSTTKVQTQKTTLPTTKDQTQNLPTTRDQSPTASAQTPKNYDYISLPTAFRHTRPPRKVVVSSYVSRRAIATKIVTCKYVPKREDRVKGVVYCVDGVERRWDGRQWRRVCVVQNCCTAARGAKDLCIAHEKCTVGQTPISFEEDIWILDENKNINKPHRGKFIFRKRKSEDEHDVQRSKQTKQTPEEVSPEEETPATVQHSLEDNVAEFKKISIRNPTLKVK